MRQCAFRAVLYCMNDNSSQSATATVTLTGVSLTQPCTRLTEGSVEGCVWTVSTTRWGATVSSVPTCSTRTRTRTSEAQPSVNVSLRVAVKEPMVNVSLKSR